MFSASLSRCRRAGSAQGKLDLAAEDSLRWTLHPDMGIAPRPVDAKLASARLDLQGGTCQGVLDSQHCRCTGPASTGKCLAGAAFKDPQVEDSAGAIKTGKTDVAALREGGVEGEHRAQAFHERILGRMRKPQDRMRVAHRQQIEDHRLARARMALSAQRSLGLDRKVAQQ